MKKKYLKIVSKKDFNFDEFMQAYLLKHHNNKNYVTYMLAVYNYETPDLFKCGWISLQENKIKQDETE